MFKIKNIFCLITVFLLTSCFNNSFSQEEYDILNSLAVEIAGDLEAYLDRLDAVETREEFVDSFTDIRQKMNEMYEEQEELYPPDNGFRTKRVIMSDIPEILGESYRNVISMYGGVSFTEYVVQVNFESDMGSASLSLISTIKKILLLDYGY